MTGEPVGYERYFEAPGHWGRDYAKASAAERSRVDAIHALLPADAVTVLDVGCGDGFVTNELHRRGVDITGVDLSEEALTHVDAPSRRGRSDALPFADRSFDCALAAQLLEHLPAGVFERTISELERVAARYVLIDVPHREDLELAQTRCPHCRTRFHISRHLRSIDERDVRGWFPSFTARESRLAGEWLIPRPRPLYALVRAAGLGARPSDAVCPACGYGTSSPSSASAAAHAKRQIKGAFVRLGLARREELIVRLERRP